jgi:SAM-dependent methyltransferase
MNFRKLSNASSVDLLKYHRSLLADRVRTETYRDAINAAVRKDDVVADLGCGSGILSFFAARAGAKRVYAIDEGPVVELARALAHDNGLADRIVFINASSFDVALEEKAGVIVTETMGNNGLDEQIVRAVDDARRRWLREDGVVIPGSIDVVIAPVDLAPPPLFEHWYDIDFSRLNEHALNAYYPIDVGEDSLVADGTPGAHVDLQRDNDGAVRVAARFEARRDAMLNGIAVWFHAQLTHEFELTNQPPNRCPSWKQSFFPIASRLRVERGEPIAIEMQTFDGIEWKWSVATSTARAEQATLHGFPLVKPR